MQRTSVFALGLVVACGGSETGNPFDDKGESTGGPGCTEVSSETVDFATETTLGFRANDVLAYAGGRHEEALQWQELRQGSYGPETGPQTLALGITPRAAKLVQYGNTKGGEIYLGCGPQLQIEADVTVQSSGGALNERVRATLVAARVEVATLNVRLDPTKLKGTLRVSPPSGWTTAALALSAQFTAVARSGSLTPSFEQHLGDSTGVSAGTGPLATFGLPPCAYGVAVPLDATGAASSATTLALLAQHTSATIADASATLDFTPGPAACQSFGDAMTPEPQPVLVIAGTLEVHAAGIDARWPVNVRTEPDGQGQLTGPVVVQLDDSTGAPLGFSQLDTSGYDSTSVELTLSLQPSGWTGAIVVYGYKNAACPPADPSGHGSPGCAGAERSEIKRFDVR